MSMKFDIQKLQEVRVQLETEQKSIKKILTQKHDINITPALQVRRVVLKSHLTFVYSAIAYSRNKIHISGLWEGEQAKWLVDKIADAKKYEQRVKFNPDQSRIFVLQFLKVPEIDENQQQVQNQELEKVA